MTIVVVLFAGFLAAFGAFLLWQVAEMLHLTDSLDKEIARLSAELEKEETESSKYV